MATQDQTFHKQRDALRDHVYRLEAASSGMSAGEVAHTLARAADRYLVNTVGPGEARRWWSAFTRRQAAASHDETRSAGLRIEAERAQFAGDDTGDDAPNHDDETEELHDE